MRNLTIDGQVKSISLETCFSLMSASACQGMEYRSESKTAIAIPLSF